jgi:D-alanyl-D-alanine carboxypeptidase/D-alanyl-D-alanine-endopeptidase (penicillin-binding protein 4)
MHGHVIDSVDLAGIEGNRQMSRAGGWKRRSAWLAALALLAAPLHAATLAEQIARLLDASTATRTAFWGIQIVDLESGRTLYELNPERGFVPASNAKLFTTALALVRLGADFTFQTRVLAPSGPDADGRIAGPLTLVGGGDPNLSGRDIPYRMGSKGGNPLAALDDLADQVAARGVKRVDGDIVGDDAWYVWQPYAEGWAVDDPQFDFGAPVSALSINDNTVSLAVRPAARAGDPAELILDPPVEYFRIGNRVRTAPAGGPREIRFERDPGSREVRLWGSIPVRDRGETLLLGIEDPAEFAALAFRQALEARGIAVAGEALARHVFPNEAGDLKQGAPTPYNEGVELARRISPPLIEDLRVTDKVSQNLHAELALRAVARTRRGIGSREAGLEEMQAFLTEIGIDPECCNFADASGLSRLDLLTPGAVVKLLRYMYASPARDNWVSLLPVGGQDGTLSARFGDGPAAGRIYAKTGTISHVSALSGYARRQGGGWLAFSILVNNYNARAAEVRGAIDRICTLIVE